MCGLIHRIGHAPNSQDCVISNHRPPELVTLLQGLPNALLLQQKDSGQHFVLVPAGAKPSRPRIPGAPWASLVLLQRSDPRWIANLGTVRHYLYPVHLSGTFLSASSFVSAIYMLAMRWMSRRYEKVFPMIDACLSDTTLSAEESQVWKSTMKKQQLQR